MKFYIASKLENAAQVSKLVDTLESWGWRCTYKWHGHGSVRGQGEKRLKEVAAEEYAGVVRADLVIVLLPGGRGTHSELGIALGQGKKVVIYSQDPQHFDQASEETCAFYWVPGAERICTLEFEGFVRWIKQKYSVVFNW